jgi:hypothetical protein
MQGSLLRADRRGSDCPISPPPYPEGACARKCRTAMVAGDE